MSTKYKRAAVGHRRKAAVASAHKCAVLFSGGLDSAVLVADATRRLGAVRAFYVSVGFAWEAEELAMAARLFARPPFEGSYEVLRFDMTDVFPPTHWAVRGEPPAFDTPDEDVYLDGRNVILLSKAAVYAVRPEVGSKDVTLLLGTLAGNPFPDATPAFFDAMSRALSLGLGGTIAVEAPFAALHKADVIRKGIELGVPLEWTLSCMQPRNGLHCGKCSKCRERRDAFREAGVEDPTSYRHTPIR
jgi:7-cyano-7-deazaguanine synthase